MTIITPTGITGITSITSTGNTLQFQNPSGADVSVSGLNVTSGTNINVTGIVTASGGFSGNINSTGVSTFSGGLRIGTGASISSPATNVLTLGTNNVETVRIDSSGNLGIGTNNPVDRLHMHNGSVSSDIVVTTLPVSQAGIRFGRIGATYQGRITYDNPNDALLLYSNGSERLRIDSSGNIGINSTSPGRRLDVVDSGANGGVIRSRVTTNNGGYFAYEALNSSGTSVFSVTHNGRINLSENILFASGQGVDFSAAGNAGGMSSELLDDYEEGTWTPTLTNFTSGSPSYQYQEGHYTKIGRYVIAQGIMGITNSNTLGSGTIQINLPFTAGSTTYGQCGPVADGSGFTSFNQFGTMVGNSASVGQFVTIGTSATGISYNQPSATWYVRFCFMYHTVT